MQSYRADRTSELTSLARVSALRARPDLKGVVGRPRGGKGPDRPGRRATARHDKAANDERTAEDSYCAADTDADFSGVPGNADDGHHREAKANDDDPER